MAVLKRIKWPTRQQEIPMIRRSITGWLVGGFALALSVHPAAETRADTPRGAAGVVREFMEAVRANDYTTMATTIADDYDYAGEHKIDVTPTAGPGVIFDRLLYRIIQLVSVEDGVVTAMVDSQFTGHYRWDLLENNGFGQPPVVGTSRSWIELRRQPDGQWRISALRPVRIRFVHADTPQPLVQDVRVNTLSSVRVSPGGPLKIEGQTTFGQLQLVVVGVATKSLNLNLETAERWSADLPAPDKPGRYYMDTAALILAPGPNRSLYFAWDEVTVPVVVR
jgi:hypothetical protein